MDEEIVYVVNNDGSLQEVTEETLFALPIPSDSEDEDLDENELPIPGVECSNKRGNVNICDIVTETDIINSESPSSIDLPAPGNSDTSKKQQPSTSTAISTTASSIQIQASTSKGLDIMKETMPLNKFEQVRRFLHFSNNLTPDKKDKLYKVRPVFDNLVQKFKSIPLEENLSIDEQMCATKARHHLKVYMPDKPHKYGYKIFVLSGVSGFAYNLEVYTGKDDNVQTDDEPDLGASSNVVVRLLRIVESHQNYKVYFDNYYTSLPLLDFLKKRGILSLGTVRRNRVVNCKLPDEKEIKTLKRGSIVEYVGDYNGTQISNLVWKDNKAVTMLSTFSGTEPVTKVKRFDQKEKKEISVPCPNVISIYNSHMGGVDLLDSLIGRYKIIMRSKKWYMRLFYHLLDLCVINSWLLYKQSRALKVSTCKELNLPEFRLQVGETLCKIDSITEKKEEDPHKIILIHLRREN
ncbi:piggyBac transposable element-derived protein 3-like [Nilaparvata lugens]|uniref:piggyBac transposable element-derived protein 3-like n=1 Tax=Nilaparvata lugens TaxID=108931 RepID=UPI00193DD297|nr:piggyBac transposable element-derived protein 3-like [Nilaparvata lugens]